MSWGTRGNWPETYEIANPLPGFNSSEVFASVGVRVWDTSTLSWIRSTATPAGASNVNVLNFPAVQTVAGTVAATQGTSPWVIGDGGGSITIDGAVTAIPTGTQDTNLIQVGGTSVTSGSGASTAGTQRIILATDQTVVPVNDNGGSLTVDGTVTSNQGTAAAVSGAWPTKITDGTDTALVTAVGELNVLATAQPGVDIGDVTINNAGGASAVNIQDGGNSITVDGTVAATQSGSWNVGQSGAPWSQNLTQVNSVALASPFDVDTGAGTQNIIGISLRKSASGGSVEYGTSTDPIRVDPTGTTAQPVNQGTSGSSDWRVDLRRGLTVTFVSIDVASSGDNTIVSGVASNKIKVLSYVMVADAAVAARWKSGASTNLSGAMSLAANGGVVAPAIGAGQGHWMETAVNTALVLNLSAAVGVRGHMSYVLEA